MKRAFDLTIVFISLPLWLPVLFILTVVVWALHGRPAFFRQKRPGLNGTPFELIKFRSMSNKRDAVGALLPDSERLTPFGRLLRSTSLDELPELINVIRGEMSLVGPRPLLMQYLPRYTERQKRRHEVPPGLTGWAQVNGRNAISWEEKFELDIWYVENRSLWLDIKILVMTVGKVVRREGISGAGEATMSEFMGSATNRTMPGTR